MALNGLYCADVPLSNYSLKCRLFCLRVLVDSICFAFVLMFMHMFVSLNQIHFVTSAEEVMHLWDSPILCVCPLSVCKISRKSYERFLIKFCGGVDHALERN